jgi:hypothetical protein
MARRALERRLIKGRGKRLKLRRFLRARVEDRLSPHVDAGLPPAHGENIIKRRPKLVHGGRPVCLRSRKRLDNRLARNLLATCCALPQRRRSEAVVNLTEPLASAAPRPFETAASAPQYRRPSPKRAVAEDAGVKRKPLYEWRDAQARIAEIERVIGRPAHACVLSFTTLCSVSSAVSKNRLTPRAAWRMRCSFSTSARRT